MVFNSAIFLFAFLPVVFVLYRLMPGMKAKNALLAVFSLFFYAFGTPVYVLLLLASVLVNWLAGILMEKDRLARGVLIGALIYNIGILFLFKYLDFFVNTANTAFGLNLHLLGLTLPLGISFYTFSGISYLLESYWDRKQITKSFLKVMLYISLFPVMSVGPILNYRTLSSQLDSRETSPEKTALGIRRFIFGLGKKVIIADTIASFVDAVFAASAPDARLVWLVMPAYAVQIYFDFSGCTDMAIGIGSMFGFELPENFRSPYTALGMTDFWSRWHISLTSWFRNYLYNPITMAKGLNRLRKKIAAKGKKKQAAKMVAVVALVVVWVLTGLWHGPNWCYVLWGVWHGLFNVLEGIGLINAKKLKEKTSGRIFLHIYTLLVVFIGSMIFCSGGMEEMGLIFRGMFGLTPVCAENTLLLQQYVTPLFTAAMIFGIVVCSGLWNKLKEKMGQAWEISAYILCVLVLVCSVMCMAGSEFTPFIYAQF